MAASNLLFSRVDFAGESIALLLLHRTCKLGERLHYTLLCFRNCDLLRQAKITTVSAVIGVVSLWLPAQKKCSATLFQAESGQILKGEGVIFSLQN